jgi:hypothetical protein
MSAASRVAPFGIAGLVPSPSVTVLFAALLTVYVHVTPLISTVSALAAIGIAALVAITATAISFLMFIVGFPFA